MLLLVQSYALVEAPYINCPSCREASKHQPSEVGSFSYWFDKLWFHTEGRLADVLIIPSSWGSQLGGHLHAITGRPLKLPWMHAVSSFMTFLVLLCFPFIF
jgi:hypothetical protein